MDLINLRSMYTQSIGTLQISADHIFSPGQHDVGMSKFFPRILSSTSHLSSFLTLNGILLLLQTIISVFVLSEKGIYLHLNPSNCYGHKNYLCYCFSHVSLFLDQHILKYPMAFLLYRHCTYPHLLYKIQK